MSSAPLSNAIANGAGGAKDPLLLSDDGLDKIKNEDTGGGSKPSNQKVLAITTMSFGLFVISEVCVMYIYVCHRSIYVYLDIIF
jgi:hypothetical protein